MKIVTTLPHSSLQKIGGMVGGLLLLGGMVAYTLQLGGDTSVRQLVESPESAASETEAVQAANAPVSSLEEEPAADGEALAAPVFQWSEHLSSAFGVREDPLEEGEETHTGIDIAVNEGTAVFAAADGVVETAALSDSGYGNEIVLTHADGLQTRYAHCSALLCSEGDAVKQGDLIALVGNTGNSTGPHLHFEVLENGEAVDPAGYLAE